ncbi:hypothetical protein EX30DRAFT_21640 [Ascodesmis nigricans]|uniref:Uncharacterized protein n=1 Tax=Ascodesmis nigricans TaxID=341454 RepID=A0A4S2N7L7_9PEZI|nr:hypothetical protein EX30DRAFT_21640 [Ascodesmis nigricans]
MYKLPCTIKDLSFDYFKSCFWFLPVAITGPLNITYFHFGAESGVKNGMRMRTIRGETLILRSLLLLHEGHPSHPILNEVRRSKGNRQCPRTK